ncbi:MAG: hypothetical protein GXP05_00315 [Alphaproteobacteria bacterium]|nr:hypothetical protein [Alphaproteobacteria bacterium]
MKLDEFVKQALLDITNGVAAAQEETKLFIAPGVVEGEAQKGGQSVCFEVAVTLSSSGGGGITVFSMGEMKGEISKEAINRISFEVPVFFAVPTRANSRHISNEGSLNPVYPEEMK